MYRIGTGIDFHIFSTDKKLVLAGVEIDYKYGLLGHSDADVLTHAVIDSILGALALGDIGEHFSDKDDSYRDIDSFLLLEKVIFLMKEKNYRVVNIDLTLIGENPKIKEYKDKMKENLSIALEVEKTQINIKATTTEKMGDIGREKGLSALSSVLLRRNDE